MINAKNLLSVLIVLFISSSCEHFPPPKTQLCVSGDNYKFICNDSREDPPDFEREYTLDYICTDGTSFSRMYDYCIDIREKLIKCRKGD